MIFKRILKQKIQLGCCSQKVGYGRAPTRCCGSGSHVVWKRIRKLRLLWRQAVGSLLKKGEEAGRRREEEKEESEEEYNQRFVDFKPHSLIAQNEGRAAQTQHSNLQPPCFHELESRGTKARASVRRKKPPSFCGGGVLEGAAKSRRKKARRLEDMLKTAMDIRHVCDSCHPNSQVPLFMVLVVSLPARLAESCRHIKQSPFLSNLRDSRHVVPYRALSQ